jgi:glycosyltransferase involved in cell wall biosynthesis
MMPPDLSIVIPVFNEEDSVGPLHRAIVDALEGEPLAYEIVLVDDGSRDATFARCKALAAADPRLVVLRLRRNAGQTQAMVAGIEHARGRVIVTMDGDLQNDPRDIPTFLAKIEEGFDLVVGWRHKRQDPFWSRRFPSIIANWLIGKVTGVPIKDNGCSLKAYRAEFVKATPLYAEMHRFIPAMMSIHGLRIAELKVRHHARRFGASKYGISRVYKVCLDLLVIKTITAFAKRPMQSFALPSGIAGALAFALFATGLADLRSGAAPSIVFMATALLFGLLAMFLIGLGVVGHIAFRTAPRGLGAIAGASSSATAHPTTPATEDLLPWRQPS